MHAYSGARSLVRVVYRAAVRAIALALVASACTQEIAAPNQTPTPPAFPARMLVAAGDAQDGVAGSELATPLAVRVVDANGQPIAGQVVNFRVVAGGGQVFAGAAVTDAQGRAAERWTLGASAADSQRVEARAVNPSTGAGIVFATFRAVARADKAALLTRTTPDSQVAAPGSAVAVAPTVKVTDRFGNPVAGAAVTFAIGAGRGSVAQPNATTDSAGLATARTWTLGTTAGANTVVASTGTLAPVTFAATASGASAPGRKWTVMVFMAADNSLAVQGVQDIDEMEAAGISPDVQVVVQGEFSAAEFARAGCAQASCAHLPNFNTFRYALTGAGAAVTGPNGTVTDIGNRNMTDPAQLKEFIQWAKATYPAEHYAVVLWNHGGGYSGLLEDLTTAGSKPMSIADLPKAFNGVGPIDLLDFDMCLMAGYETLVEVSPFAKYVVFSEETEPGEGDPYTGMLKALRANPSADGRTVAGMFVDEWAKFYVGHRASTTKSAYDMAGFQAFESALNTVATKLAADPSNAAVRAAAQKAQRFEIAQLADLGTFVDTLAARTTDASLGTALGALKNALGGSFRVKNAARTGSASGANNVARATGINLLLPSGTAADRLPDAGPLSFAEYQRLLPNTAWTAFLAAYLKAGPTVASYDQGERRFETYVIWDSASTANGADIDLWVLEPDGNLYIPFMGTVSPNGHLTPDSYDTGVSYEGYLTNRFVQAGRYKLYVNLYTDPRNTKPRYDLQYRFGQTNDFKSLFSPNYPRLSLGTSWLDDANATFDKVDNDAYTDLQLAAYADLGTAGGAQLMSRSSAGALGPMMARGAVAGSSTTTRITNQQLATVRRNWASTSAARRAARQERIAQGGASILRK